jgi:hypothetical protein
VLLLLLLLFITVLPYCGEAPLGAVNWQLHAAVKLSNVAAIACERQRILSRSTSEH